MEKTTYELKPEVEMSFAMPKTLTTEAQQMPMGGAMIEMYAVYGRDMTDRRVWCVTFVDRDESMAWVMASKVYGRAVKGAVIAKQEPANDGVEEGSVDESTTGESGGGSAEKPN
jgi:hypothetical protein